MQKPRKFYHSPIYVDRHEERMAEMASWRRRQPSGGYGWWQFANIATLLLLLAVIFIFWKFIL